MGSFCGRSRGATLVETLIAIVLMAIVMATLVPFAARTMRQSADAQLRSKAALLAQEKAEEIMRARHDIEEWRRAAEMRYPHDRDGDDAYRFFDSDDLEAFRWEWVITPPERLPGMGELTVRVFRTSPTRRDFSDPFELHTLLFFPTEVSEGERP